MNNIQEILNQIQKSEHNSKEDKLSLMRIRKVVYEYNPQGEIIDKFTSVRKMRQLGIRLEKNRPSVITRDGRIFSIVKLDNFEEWYRDRKKQISHTVKQYTKDWVFIREWKTVTEAAKSINQDRQNIKRACRTGGVAGGYRWSSNFLVD